MGSSHLLLLGLLATVLLAHFTTANPDRIYSMSRKSRENQSLKYLTRGPDVRAAAVSVSSAVAGKSRRPPPHDERVIIGPECQIGFGYVYVPPLETMKFKPKLEKNNYENDVTCGWWFWTDEDYLFKSYCERIKMYANDYLVFINEHDQTTVTYEDVVLKDGIFVDFGTTNDVSVGMSTDATDSTHGFRCNITSEARPVIPDCVCGVPNADPGKRILGGSESMSQPWNAMLKSSQFGTVATCTGVIITAEYILTSAICIAFYEPEDIWVDVGILDTNNILPSTTYQGAERLTHPGYAVTELTCMYCLGMLRVDTPMVFSSTLSPICLPDEAADFDFEPSTLMGWGTVDPLDSLSSANKLHEAPSVVMPNDMCAQMLAPTVLAGVVDHFTLCAIDLDPLDQTAPPRSYPCHRDWGAPLVTDVSNPYQELIGILYSATFCNLGPDPVPDQYVRITEALPWIYENIPRDIAFCPPPSE